MKKIALAAVVVLATVSLAACGKTAEPETTTEETTTEAVTTTVPETTTEKETTTTEPETTTEEIETQEGLITPQSTLDEAKRVVVSADGDQLTLRLGPSSDYDQVTMIDDGTELTITAEDSGWGYTVYNRQAGWVSMDWVTEK